MKKKMLKKMVKHEKRCFTELQKVANGLKDKLKAANAANESLRQQNIYLLNERKMFIGA